MVDVQIVKVMTTKCDFHVFEHSEEYTLEEGYELLETKRGKDCVSAQRLNDKIIIKWAQRRCPYCGSWVSAASKTNIVTPSYSLFSSIFGKQCSIFEQNQTLIFNDSIVDVDAFRCSECGTSFSDYKDETIYIVSETPNSIIISRSIMFYELYSCDWIRNQHIKVDSLDELQECITFNVETGSAYISLENSNGIVIASQSLGASGIYRGNEYGKLVEELIKNWSMRINVREFLERKYGDALPFKYTYLKDLIGMNIFVNCKLRERAVDSGLNCMIEGFDFIQLRNFCEYQEVINSVSGNTKNALTAYLNGEDEKVIAIYKYDHYLAYLCVNDKEVQVVFNEEYLGTEESRLFMIAYCKWLSKNDLHDKHESINWFC